MGKRTFATLGTTAVLGLGIFVGACLQSGQMVVIPGANAAAEAVAGPTDEVPDRYVYYPGSEALAEGEVRVIACGTGMPDQRIAQASACFLFEFGNGEKLIFDLGTGSMRNIASLLIPYEYLDKIFISHLHTDHWGELGAIWAGGWTSGRPGPLRIWGPSGETPEMGTAYAVEHFQKSNNWDFQTRAVKITPLPGQIEVHEFDYRKENQVVYESNGIVVRSWPAIHIGDGPVSFGIEYAGLKLVFAGDTTPNMWFVKYPAELAYVLRVPHLGPLHGQGHELHQAASRGRVPPPARTLPLCEGGYSADL